MKRYVAMILCILAAASCRHDEPEYLDAEAFTQGQGTKSFTVLRESDLDLCDRTLWGDAWNATGQEASISTKASSSTVIMSASGILSCVLSGKVHQIVGIYESIDINGNPINVSGKIIYPTDRPIKNMILVSHYTIGANFECPSESFSFESLYAALGYAVVIADYIGFGITVDMVHPYLQADVTASNVIDMGIAARPFLEERGLKPLSDEIILVGYSQGGATTMHVQRMLETAPQYAGLFKIKKNYAGSGPYDIARTYDYSVAYDITGIPSAIPMIIQGMSIGMDKPLDMSYFFREPLLSNYNEWLNSKRYTVMQINEKIGCNSLSGILTSNAADKSRKETARFYRELINNSVSPSYMPKSPLYMFHSEDDKTVPFVNSQVLQRQYRFSDVPIEYDFDHYGTHQNGALTFILKVANKLKEDEK